MPIPSCPPEIKQLMTNTVLWESWLGFDGHAEPSYGPQIPVSCFQEAFGTMSSEGGLGVLRRADGTVVQPLWDLFFDGDNPVVLSFQVYDRFTPGGVGSDSTQALQAIRINTLYGPPFDNKHPWVVQVTV
jgi:hypothetical protein